MGAYPKAILDEHLHLVVSADKSKAGMVCNAAQIVSYLTVYVLFKLIIKIVDGTGKHKILPYNKSQLVA